MSTANKGSCPSVHRFRQVVKCGLAVLFLLVLVPFDAQASEKPVNGIGVYIAESPRVELNSPAPSPTYIGANMDNKGSLAAAPSAVMHEPADLAPAMAINSPVNAPEFSNTNTLASEDEQETDGTVAVKSRALVSVETMNTAAAATPGILGQMSPLSGMNSAHPSTTARFIPLSNTFAGAATWC